ncbi:hypothetical protein, partial [Streptomyces sp. NPDC002758]
RTGQGSLHNHPNPYGSPHVPDQPKPLSYTTPSALYRYGRLSALYRYGRLSALYRYGRETLRLSAGWNRRGLLYAKRELVNRKRKPVNPKRELLDAKRKPVNQTW